MRIAICEDDREQALQLAGYVQQHPNTNLHEIYNSADNLLADFSSGKRYDLVFLDIQMDGTNGFQAAGEINRLYSDDNLLIAFTTSTESYAALGYEIAWRYLVKPIDIEKIHDCIDQAVDELDRRVFLVKTNNGTISINMKSIVYIDSNYGIVTIHSADGKHETKMSLKTVSGILPHNKFTQVHRSYYINLSHVAGYKGKQITMSNGDKIPVSKDKKADFVKVHTTFLGGGDYRLH